MLSYKAAHDKVTRMRGRASQKLCACGRPGKDWAYQHSGATLISPEGREYSEDPDDYAPMCRSCHRKLDQEATPERYVGLLTSLSQGHGAAKTRERFLTEPEFAMSQVTSLLSNSNKRRRCEGCGHESTTYGLASHQRGTKHVGYEEI